MPTRSKEEIKSLLSNYKEIIPNPDFQTEAVLTSDLRAHQRTVERLKTSQARVKNSIDLINAQKLKIADFIKAEGLQEVAPDLLKKCENPKCNLPISRKTFIQSYLPESLLEDTTTKLDPAKLEKYNQLIELNTELLAIEKKQFNELVDRKLIEPIIKNHMYINQTAYLDIVHSSFDVDIDKYNKLIEKKTNQLKFLEENPETANKLFIFKRVLDSCGKVGLFNSEELMIVKEIFHEIEDKPADMIQAFELQNFDADFEAALKTAQYRDACIANISSIEEKLDKLLEGDTKYIISRHSIGKLKGELYVCRERLRHRGSLPYINRELRQFYSQLGFRDPKFTQEFKVLQTDDKTERSLASTGSYYRSSTKEQRMATRLGSIIKIDTNTPDHFAPLVSSIDKMIKKQEEQAKISAAFARSSSSPQPKS